jgi:hypothetical protein
MISFMKTLTPNKTLERHVISKRQAGSPSLSIYLNTWQTTMNNFNLLSPNLYNVGVIGYNSTSDWNMMSACIGMNPKEELNG